MGNEYSYSTTADGSSESKTTANWIAGALVFTLLAIAWALSSVLSHQTAAVIYYLASFLSFMIIGLQIIEQAERPARSIFLWFSSLLSILLILIAASSLIFHYPGIWKIIFGWPCGVTGIILLLAVLFYFLASNGERVEKERRETRWDY